jgi:hypothetical protein
MVVDDARRSTMMEPDVELEYARAQSFHESSGDTVEPPLALDSPRADGSTRFAHTVFQMVQGSNLIVAKLADVPAGRRATVRFATANILVEDTAELLTAYIYCPAGIVIRHFLALSKRYNHSAATGQPGLDYWSISQPTLLEALPGESIWVVISKDFNASEMRATFTIFGDLVDA